MSKIVLDKTAFVRHPVLPELKRQLNSEGYRIVDASFAPADAEIRDGSIGAEATIAVPQQATAANSATGGDGAGALNTSAALDALGTAGGNFMAFKSAAKKVLGDATPDKKDEIVAALIKLLSDTELKTFLTGKGVGVSDETRDQLEELAKAA
ncbi:hypothetical protein [Paradevosia shaoguanensis]|uniref:hypothetical protein n=1 Tax=Paradevosia shaoguanensis TaxID=1335043 RepID=UPI0019331C09|nr:hypothetical protein [Paradevosia shaoguanensis]